MRQGEIESVYMKVGLRKRWGSYSLYNEKSPTLVDAGPLVNAIKEKAKVIQLHPYDPPLNR